jgi:Tfp pilus assembly protein PilW
MPWRGERGFTLVELLVAMPLTLVVLGGLTLMLTTITHWNSQTREQVALQTEARAGVSRLAGEIRGAFVGDGTSAILSATASSVTFYTPDGYATTVTGSTESSFHLEKVAYQVTGGTLQRQFMTSTNTFPSGPPWTFSGSMSPWMTVVGQVNSVTSSSVFTYYTQAGAQASPATALPFPIADPSGIRAVGITLTLSTGGSQPQKFTFSDLVALREMDN